MITIDMRGVLKPNSTSPKYASNYRNGDRDSAPTITSFDFNGSDTVSTIKNGFSFSGTQTKSIPSGQTEGGLLFPFTGNADPSVDQSSELRYGFSAMSEFYMHQRMFVPANFFHRLTYKLTLSGSLTNWLVGDTVRGVDGSSTGIINYKSGQNIWLAFPANGGSDSVWVGSVTNLTRAETRTSTARALEADNNKVQAFWCDDHNIENDNDGYSARGASPTIAFEMRSNGTGDGGNVIYYHFGADRQVLGDGLPNSTSAEVDFIRPADFGTWMDLVYHVKMASTETAEDGVIEFWLKRSGESSYTKLFQQTNAKIGARAAALPAYSAFKWGYAFGYSNSGYAATTNFYLSKLEISTAQFNEITNPVGVAWKIASAYRVGQKLPLNVIYPRPDAETSTTALHRKANSNWQYEVRVCVQGGEPPFRHQLISAPFGATIVQEYDRTVDGVTGLTVHSMPTDYATVKWPSPSGTGNFTVRVTDQSDSYVDVTWSAIKDDTAFVVFDSTNGNDANTGTYASPKKTFATGLWKNSTSDSSFATKIAAFKDGTYTPYATTAGTDCAITSSKPRSYLGIGSNVNFDCVSGLFGVSVGEVAFRNIKFLNNRSVGNTRLINFINTYDNCHFSKLTFSNISAGTLKDDNPACIFFSQNYPSYSHNLSFVDCTVESTCQVQLHALFTVDGLLSENNTFYNNARTYHNGSVCLAYKDDIRNMSSRFNKLTGSSSTIFIMNQQQALGGSANQEVCFNWVSTTDDSSNGNTIMWNQNSTVYNNPSNTHCYRNTIVSITNAISTQKWIGGSSVLLSGNAYVATNLADGTGYTTTTPTNVKLVASDLDANGKITNATKRTANLGKIGWEFAST